MREIRMLRAMWRVLETEPRTFLNGHAGGNAGYSQGVSYGSPRQRSTLPFVEVTDEIVQLANETGECVVSTFDSPSRPTRRSIDSIICGWTSSA